MTWLEDELSNWGLWLNYDAAIGPEYPCCRSIESTHIAEVGETMEEDREPPKPIPDVPAAERIHKHVRKLQRMEQMALAIRYGGLPAVFRNPRASQQTLDQMADNAEKWLARHLERAA